MTAYGGSSRTVNAQNELTSGTGYTDTYDDNGNMTGGLPVIVIGGTTNGTMTYDAWNDLVAVHYGASSESFWVDANGMRYATFLGSSLSSITTFSASGQPLEDDAGSGGSATHVTSVWGIDYVNDLVNLDYSTGSSLSSLHYYAEHNPTYSVTSMVDHSGNISDRTIFDPYGKPTTITGGTFQQQYDTLFQGGRYDYLTQTYWFQNRNYSPAIGTWLQQDAQGYVDGADLYEFVLANPVGYVDPSGLAAAGRMLTPAEAARKRWMETPQIVKPYVVVINGQGGSVLVWGALKINEVHGPGTHNSIGPIIGRTFQLITEHFATCPLKSRSYYMAIAQLEADQINTKIQNQRIENARQGDLNAAAGGALIIAGLLSAYVALPAVAVAASNPQVDEEVAERLNAAESGVTENAGASSTLTNFSGKVGQAKDGVLGGFVKADGTVDFVPFTQNGLIGHSAAQAAGAIPADAVGGFSVTINSAVQIQSFYWNSVLNGEQVELSQALQQQIRQALASVIAK